jgi:hypothetical protein
MKFGIRSICTLALACIVGLGASASPVLAVEIDGIKLDDTIRLANQDLKLNGAGIRHRKEAKVLVAGLYLTGKYTSAEEVIAAPGPKRVTLVLMQDLDTEKFVRNYIAGMQANADKTEKASLIYQFVKFGEICASIGILKKGDVIIFDWIPEKGTYIVLNGKKLSEPIPNEGFYNVFLKFLVGTVPADAELKQKLLNQKT